MSTYSISRCPLRICIDRIDSGNISGWIYSQRLSQPMQFNDLVSLLLSLDELFDVQNYPQAFQRMRSFGNSRRPGLEAADAVNGMDEDTVLQAKGSVLTFDLFVQTRRSATWQGFIIWADGSRTRFESALEILHLLNARLESEQ